jgi:hypothetical protein
MLYLLSFSIDVTGFPAIGLSWLGKINDATQGLLDLVLAAMVMIPVLIMVWGYLSRSGSSDE